MYTDQFGKELTDHDIEVMHDDMLDEVVGDLQIGNLTFSPSRVLKTCDQIAYRCSLNEYIDVLVDDGTLVEL